MKLSLAGLIALAALMPPMAMGKDLTEEELAIVSRDGKYQKQEITRHVRSGKQTLISRLLGGTAINCAPWENIEVKFTTEPAHGKVELPKETAVASSFPMKEMNDRCRGKKFPSLAVKYKSETGYTGSDLLEFVVLWPNGFLTEYKITVEVH